MPFVRLDNFAFSAAPKCCSSSMMTRARSANLTAAEASACVPTTTLSLPRRSFSFVSLNSAADAALDIFATSIPSGRHRNSDLFSRQCDSRGRPQGDLGLAEADVAANHPIHRVTSLQIIQHIPD